MTAPKTSFRRYLFPVIAVPIFILITVLCVMNAGDVPFLWSPLHAGFPVPLFAVMLSFFAIGFLAGSLLTWLDRS